MGIDDLVKKQQQEQQRLAAMEERSAYLREAAERFWRETQEIRPWLESSSGLRDLDWSFSGPTFSLTTLRRLLTFHPFQEVLIGKRSPSFWRRERETYLRDPTWERRWLRVVAWPPPGLPVVIAGSGVRHQHSYWHQYCYWRDESDNHKLQAAIQAWLDDRRLRNEFKTKVVDWASLGL